MKYKDLTGTRFGRATAVRYVGRELSGNALWECRCDCGEVFETSSSNLKTGRTRSCGCLRKENARKHLPEANKVWRIPVVVVSKRKKTKCGSAAEAGRLVGCAPCTVLRYMKSGGEFRGYRFE